MKGRGNAGGGCPRHDVLVRYAGQQNRSGLAQGFQQLARIFDMLNGFKADRRIGFGKRVGVGPIRGHKNRTSPGVIPLGISQSFVVLVVAASLVAGVSKDSRPVSDSARKIQHPRTSRQRLRGPAIAVHVICADSIDCWCHLPLAFFHVRFPLTRKLKGAELHGAARVSARPIPGCYGLETGATFGECNSADACTTPTDVVPVPVSVSCT